MSEGAVSQWSIDSETSLNTLKQDETARFPRPYRRCQPPMSRLLNSNARGKPSS